LELFARFEVKAILRLSCEKEGWSSGRFRPWRREKSRCRLLAKLVSLRRWVPSIRAM
jgi:hypothetical protein